MSFDEFVLRESYKKLKELGDPLEFIKGAIDWEAFRPLIASIFHDDKVTGGRPHTDEILIIRALVLQSMYNLSDQDLEFQINDRISFRNFLGYPQKVPDFTTFWRIREKLRKNKVDKKIWKELQRQLDEKGYKINKGVIQDATYVQADVGRKRQAKEKRKKRKGVNFRYKKKRKQHMDKDGSFAVKNNQVHFGYKTHIKIDVENQLIRETQVTTASVHDNKVDLVRKGDKIAYRDKGYFGKPLRVKSVIDKTMKRATRGRKLNGGEQKRNRSISKVRGLVERPFAVMKRVFNGGHVMVKTLGRVRMKETFRCFAYNLYQLRTLSRKEASA